MVYLCMYIKSEVHCLHTYVCVLPIHKDGYMCLCMHVYLYIHTYVCNWYHLGVIHTYVGMRALYTGVCKCGPV